MIMFEFAILPSFFGSYGVETSFPDIKKEYDCNFNIKMLSG